MSNYAQLSGTTADVDLTNFEYEQRSGSTVNIELSLSSLPEILFNGVPVTGIEVNGQEVTGIEYNGQEL